MLGTVINARYEVLEKVGSGGMGSVYRVRDRDHEGREVALKLLTPQDVLWPVPP
ncbi:MAG: hypothetical protein HYZ53_15100 [Planctomycetes bacterium]|nr:hypothetical protein [Planctomycetota bacterium]